MKPTVISLFSGAMGLDLGFEAEGFEIRVANDINKYAVDTIEKNRPHIPVIPLDIREVPTDEILGKARLGVGEATVVTAGPPCQPFSTTGRRRSINDKRRTLGGDLVFKFLRVVKEARPQFFVFENVTGLLSAAKQHISFYERIKKKEGELPPEQKLGSAFEEIIDKFKKTGYHISDNSLGILNAADYGVAQKRKRLIIMGSRDVEPPPLPPREYAPSESSEVLSGSKKPWVSLREALRNLDDPNPEHVKFPSWGKYLKHIPPGGCWINMKPKELQKEAMGGAYDLGTDEKAGKRGGRRGFYRRLSWDKPAPTLVTSPVMKATCLCHPDELRPLSVREYARLQQFPDDWEFAGPIVAKYRQIGEAVPVGLAQAISKMIKWRWKHDHESPHLQSYRDEEARIPKRGNKMGRKAHERIPLAQK